MFNGSINEKMEMPSNDQVVRYLSTLLSDKRSSSEKKKIHLKYFGPLTVYQRGEEEKKETKEKKGQKNLGKDSSQIKRLGYGVPYLIVFSEGPKRGGHGTLNEKKLILSTMRIGNGFGHDYRADRIDNLVLSYDTWNTLPNHCRIYDLGTFNKNNSSMISLRDAGEFFLLRPMVRGTEYFKDLERILSTEKLEDYDLPRAKALAEYLAGIHSKKNKKTAECRELYARKIRDTVGHGECVFGLADSYPAGQVAYLKDGELETIEKMCIGHRWRLRKNFSRLCQVHGDFHPWNILFTGNPKKNPTKFGLLDRSRGEWGEPADDVCALSINYIFNSLRSHGELKGAFLDLYNEFMNTYVSETEDEGLFDAIPLFYTFRALVVASPVWYPDLTDGTRRKIFDFTENILQAKRFDPSRVNDYLANPN